MSAASKAGPEQLVLDLAHRQALGAEDFLVSASNAAAIDIVDSLAAAVATADAHAAPGDVVNRKQFSSIARPLEPVAYQNGRSPYYQVGE